MEKLASRHAISELFNWISLMENVTQEDEENLKSAVGSNVIQDYLQKYKVLYFLKQVYVMVNHVPCCNVFCVNFFNLSFTLYSLICEYKSSADIILNLCFFFSPIQGFRVDLTCKQLTVDFVNQSVLQIGAQDAESKRSDKTDFAERLGAMNRRWQILQGRINERVRPKTLDKAVKTCKIRILPLILHK